jgi:hypothetical protein
MSRAGMEPLSEAELDQPAERLEQIQNESALSLEGLGHLAEVIAIRGEAP